VSRQLENSSNPVEVAGLRDLDSLEARPDDASPAWLAEVLTTVADNLKAKYKSYYVYYLERAIALIETTCAQKPSISPLIAAVNLGVQGDFALIVGDDHDAFNILVQAALRILSDESALCRPSNESAVWK
jgi:hypothetical protein